MAKETGTKKYTVLHPLVHDEERYEAGDTVDLSGDHAPALLRRGIIAEPKPAKDDRAATKK